MWGWDVEAVNDKLALAMGTGHLPPQGLNYVLLQLPTFNTPLKGAQVENSNEALCALGKMGRTGLQIGIFRRNFYEPNFLYLLMPRKALKPLTETSAPCDWQQPSTKTCA